jgi:selenocysteine-specific translation elongation factor
LLVKTHSEIAKHVAAHPNIIVTSSFKSQGMETLRAELASLAKIKETTQII